MTKLEVVYYTGTWDLFHIGHLRSLEKARELGDRLIVGVTTDDFSESYKGIRPIIPLEQRCEILSALRCVDVAIPTRFAMDFEPMIKYGVTIRAVGPEYGSGLRQPEEHIEALRWMGGQGIKVVRVPRTPGVSTTLIKKRIREVE